MVLEAPSADLLDHVRLSEVARRAEVSTGALYHYWDSQDDYRAELLAQILSPAPYSLRTSVEVQVREAAAGGISLHELVQAVCAENTEQFFGNSDFRLQVALWLRTNRGIRRRLSEQYASVADEWIEFYRTVFDVYGLKLRSPFTYESLATLLTALLEGLILRVEIDADAVSLETAGVVGDWDLFSCAVLGLLPAVTQDAGEPDQDLWHWSTDRRASESPPI